MKSSPRKTGALLRGIIRAEYDAQSVAIGDIIVIEVRTRVVARYPGIIVVVLLRKPLVPPLIFFRANPHERYGVFQTSRKFLRGTGL